MSNERQIRPPFYLSEDDELRRRVADDSGNRTDLDDVIAAFGFDRAELEAET